MKHMSHEERIIRASDAQTLLNNKLFKEAFAAVSAYLDSSSLSCDPDDKDKAQRIIISKQLLAAIQREITRVVEDGDIAEIQMNEINKKKGLFKFVR